MAVKTFTTGEVLTASDTNTYLANSGLVYISTVTANTATIAVDNVFTSTYTSYRVVIQFENVTLTGSYFLRLRAGGTAVATGYYYGGYTYFYDGTAPGLTSGNNVAGLPVGVHTAGGFRRGATVDIICPQIAENTTFIANAACGFSNYIRQDVTGVLANTNAYDGFQLTQDSGGTIDAIVTVYGYRKA